MILFLSYGQDVSPSDHPYYKHIYLRLMPITGATPKVVFCTTENDIDHISRALNAGANEYIMKPFDKEIVEAKFQEVGLI